MTDQLSLLSVNVLNTFSHSPQGRRAQPEGAGDYIIVVISVLIVIAALYLCIKYLFRPEETRDSHIKNIIFDDKEHEKREGDTR